MIPSIGDNIILPTRNIGDIATDKIDCGIIGDDSPGKYVDGTEWLDGPDWIDLEDWTD